MPPFTRLFVPFADTKSFDKLIIDYLNDEGFLRPFYMVEDDIDGIQKAINSYKNPRLNRQNLRDVLIRQYSESGISEIPDMVNQNIQSLLENKTFTVTAGHQLNIFSGPLYVIYKLLSAINLAENLNKLIPSNHFVPVYWMATEDHDIEEISSINLFGKQFKWESEWKGVSGKMPLDGLDVVIQQLKNTFGNSAFSEEISSMISDAYQNSSNLAVATRKWINKLLGKYGLVILDGNEALLKKTISDILIEEGINQTSFPLISKTTAEIEKKYHSQANPREINLFYLGENFRERLVNENDKIRVLNTEILFTREQLKNEINNHPEKFSPNVLMRPLYQESILPNITFIGGPAEIAYWLELRNLFEHHHVPMPVLMHRCSVLILEKSVISKLDKLSIKTSDVFLPADELIKQFLQSTDKESFSLEKTISSINTEFVKLGNTVAQIDNTLRAPVESENQKITTSLHNLEEKIIRSLKKKNETEVNQIRKLKEKLFPAGKLQERVDTFMPYYLIWGSNFIEGLKNNLNPLEKKFIVLEEAEADSGRS